MTRKSFFDKQSSSGSSSRSKSDSSSASSNTRENVNEGAPKVKGDLDGDGDVDWVDRLWAIVNFIQTPKGQTFFVIMGAVCSAVINVIPYTKTVITGLNYLGVGALAPFSWLIALIFWGLLQAVETAPRTSMWDFETKMGVMRMLQGLHIPLLEKSDLKNRQSDVLFWQEATINDAQQKRLMMWGFCILAHLIDLGMLWGDYPLFNANPLYFIWQNCLVVVALMFSFEAIVGLGQLIRYFSKGKAVTHNA
jgi:hypothetical protein